MATFKPARPGALYSSKPAKGLKGTGRPTRLVLGTAIASSAPPPVVTLVSIAVTPASPTISVGATQQFVATGTYSDSSTANITSAVTWTSSNTGDATVAAGGLATGVSAGSTTIIATDASSGVHGQTGLTVQSALPIGPGFLPAVVFQTIGDSIVAGNTFPQAQYAAPRQLCASLGQYWAQGANLAIPGASLNTGSGTSQIPLQFTTGSTSFIQSPSGEDCCVPGMPNVWLLEGGGNDVLIFSRTQAQAAADFATTAQTVTAYLSGISAGSSGIGHILLVMTPTGRHDGDLSALALSIRSNYTSWAASGVRVILVDAALDPNIGQGANTSSSYYVDGTHLSQTGAALLAGIIQTTLTATGVVAAVNAAAPARLVDAVNSAPGLFGRYRMSHALVANGGTLLWVDSSGNGNHLLRLQIAQRPGFSTAVAGYGGKGVATFNGSQDITYSIMCAIAYGADRNNGVQVLTLNPPYTIYCVGNMTSTSANASMYGYTSEYVWGDGGSPSKYQFIPGATVPTTVPVGTTPHMFVASIATGGGLFYVDASATPVGTVTATQAAQTDVTYGAIADSGGQSPTLAMVGNIETIIICAGFAHAPSDIHPILVEESAFIGQSWT